MTNSSVLVAVAGGSGSGKSTLVEQLCSHLREHASLLLMDNYYHDRSDITLQERAVLDYDAPDALDLELLVSHLEQLGSGKSVFSPQYDFGLHTRKSDRITVEAKRWIIVDGILVLASPAVRSRIDFSVYVDAPEELRLTRRLARDTQSRGRSRESVLEQWEKTVKPNHDRYVEPSKNYADHIVSGEGTRGLSEVLELLQRFRN